MIASFDAICKLNMANICLTCDAYIGALFALTCIILLTLLCKKRDSSRVRLKLLLGYCLYYIHMIICSHKTNILSMHAHVLITTIHLHLTFSLLINSLLPKSFIALKFSCSLHIPVLYRFSKSFIHLHGYFLHSEHNVSFFPCFSSQFLILHSTQ
jgi:hypothetical protein